MMNINFESYNEVAEGIGFIDSNEFFSKIKDLGFTIKKILFENQIWDGFISTVSGIEFEEIINSIHKDETDYIDPKVTIIKDSIDNRILVVLEVFDILEDKIIRHEWLVM